MSAPSILFLLPQEYDFKKGVKEKGVLVSADEEGFVLEVIRMEKPEGARRKQQVVHQLPLKYEEVKQATYLLKV